MYDFICWNVWPHLNSCPSSLSGEQMDKALWNWHPFRCWGAPPKPYKPTAAAAPLHSRPRAQASGARQSPQWWQNTEAEAQRAEAEWKEWARWRPREPGLWAWTGTVTSGLRWTWAPGSSGQAVSGFSSNFDQQRELWDKESEDHRLASARACVCWGTVLHSDGCGAAAMHLSVPGKDLGVQDLWASVVSNEPLWKRTLLLLLP